MKVKVFRLSRDDGFIKLGQLLKAAGLAMSGAEAKDAVQNGLVLVDGAADTRRGRKLYGGETVSYSGSEIKIEKES